MFERFTDSARRVVVIAQEEARRLGHNYIGTEHVLLGLLGEGKGRAAVVLKEAGLSLDSVRENVDHLVGPGNDSPGAHIPFTPRAKKVLELSLREALQLHHNYIGTEHILLGLIREGEGVAMRILEIHAMDPQAIRERLLEESEPGKVRRLGPPSDETIILTSGPYAARLDRMQASLDRIERRLDALGVPPAADQDAGPGNPKAPGTGTDPAEGDDTGTEQPGSA